MKLEEAAAMQQELWRRAEADGDRLLVVYFSREEDKYQATAQLDAGDALIVIGKLISTFNLSAEAIVLSEGLAQEGDAELLRGMIQYALDAPDDPAGIKKILRDALNGKGGAE